MPGLFDLIKPGDGARHATERELHRRVEAWGQRSPNFVYHGPADFILRHGRHFEPRPCPDQYLQYQGPPQNCFGNALLAAEACPELTYVEGVYAVQSTVMAHAWCVDSQGGVVELTYVPTEDERLRSTSPVGGYDDEGHSLTGEYLPVTARERWCYFGVEFPKAEFVRDAVERMGTVSVIDKPEDGYPLLRQPWTPLMTHLP